MEKLQEWRSTLFRRTSEQYREEEKEQTQGGKKVTPGMRQVGAVPASGRLCEAVFEDKAPLLPRLCLKQLPGCRPNPN